jgi:hypothetical protein
VSRVSAEGVDRWRDAYVTHVIRRAYFARVAREQVLSLTALLVGSPANFGKFQLA